MTGAGDPEEGEHVGLVDQFTLVVAPVALGKGLPLFSELAAPTPLKLMSSKTFPGGRSGANLSGGVNPRCGSTRIVDKSIAWKPT